MNDTAKPSPAARRKLRAELKKAAALDPGLQAVLDLVGMPEPRARAAGFETLLRIIVSQQLSTHAAAAIWRKLRASCRGQITHRKILNRTTRQLRACGLSRQKIEYAKGLAQMIRSRELQPDALDGMDTPAVVAALTRVRGFGKWSAEIYAMFALGRADVYPADDLALQVAIGRYFRLKTRPSAKRTEKLSRRWSPHRSAVALLMWRYYGATTLDA